MRTCILSLLALIHSYGTFAQPTFQKTWGGVWTDVAYDMAPSGDGNYVVTGYTFNSSLSCNNVLLMKIDEVGDTLWTRVYGESGGQTGYKVIRVKDGGYAIAGQAGGAL